MTQPQRWLYGMIHTHRLHNALSQAAAMGCNIVGNGGGSSASAKKKSIPSMQNKMMQLRKCCMHPYLFFEPTGDGHTDENIVQVRDRTKTKRSPTLKTQKALAPRAGSARASMRCCCCG